MGCLDRGIARDYATLLALAGEHVELRDAANDELPARSDKARSSSRRRALTVLALI